MTRHVSYDEVFTWRSLGREFCLLRSVSALTRVVHATRSVKNMVSASSGYRPNAIPCVMLPRRSGPSLHRRMQGRRSEVATPLSACNPAGDLPCWYARGSSPQRSLRVAVRSTSLENTVGQHPCAQKVTNANRVARRRGVLLSSRHSRSRGHHEALHCYKHRVRTHHAGSVEDHCTRFVLFSCKLW